MRTKIEGMSTPRPYHRPVKLTDTFFDNRKGGEDPAALNEAAHQSAHALISQGRANLDPEVTARLVQFTDVFGLETIAMMWAHAPAISLPGALWRIYALRDLIQKNSEIIARAYEKGMHTDWASRVVSGVADPPTQSEIVRVVDEILTGAYTGEFDIALERFGAFCRVVSAGQEVLAHDVRTAHLAPSETRLAAPSKEVRTEASNRAQNMLSRAKTLRGTAIELEASAAKWRAGTLD